MTDINYINGAIAVKESRLLGEKLLRLADSSAGEALRVLAESGFGGGKAQDAEGMCEAEERALDAFIREYAPSEAEKLYLLLPRDFHNAKAVCKAERTGADVRPMLAPEGLIPVADLIEAVRAEDAGALGEGLAEAVKRARSEELSGAEIGAVFEAALFRRLKKALRRRGLLRRLLAERADRTNILTAMRSADFEHAQPFFVEGGTLGEKELSALFDSDMVGGNALKGTPYESYFSLCAKARESKTPFLEAEQALASFEAEYFRDRQCELEGKEPFLYYVFRRRAEIANVRILLVCLGAEMPAAEIRRRFRAM